MSDERAVQAADFLNAELSAELSALRCVAFREASRPEVAARLEKVVGAVSLMRSFLRFAGGGDLELVASHDNWEIRPSRPEQKK